MIQFITNSVEETQNIAKKLAQEVYPGTNILFFAEMGSGKTHFIQSFLQARGITESISSPTYQFVHSYKNNKETLAHYDLYRFEENQESIGIDEDFLDSDTTTLIEWAERLEVIPFPYIKIAFEKESETQRIITLQFFGFSLSDTQLKELIQFYRIPPHVQNHINAVTQVAGEVCDNLLEQGAIIDKKNIQQAAQLHDLVRYIDFKGGLERSKFDYEVNNDTWDFWVNMQEKHKGKHHADVVAEILKNKGFSDLGKIIIAHKSRYIFEGFNNTAEKILHYADKRCAHDKIVPLQERIEDLKKRYWESKPDEVFWEDLFKKNLELEEELLKLN